MYLGEAGTLSKAKYMYAGFEQMTVVDICVYAI